MSEEIERKFLVKDSSYKNMAVSYSRITQGYICSDKGKTVRVRIRNGKGYLTIKGRLPTTDLADMKGNMKSRSVRRLNS